MIKMIQLVQSTDAGKAKIVGLADRWATLFIINILKIVEKAGVKSTE